MIGKKIQDALNAQIKEEIGSAHIYLSMAAYFHAEGWDGMAHWMRIQTQEEMIHAMKMFDHIIKRGGRARVLAIDEPKGEWASPLDAFQDAYKHEQYISGRINDLVEIAVAEKDSETEAFLEWYVDEQEEEEESASEVVELLEGVGDSASDMTKLDAKLGKRK